MRAVSIDIGCIDDQGRSHRVQLADFGDDATGPAVIAIEELARWLADSGKSEEAIKAVREAVERV